MGEGGLRSGRLRRRGRGSRSARGFGPKFPSFSEALYPFALRMTRDVESAFDLVQETLLKAYLHRERFERGTNLKAWLRTIMRNTFITQYNRRKVSPVRPSAAVELKVQHFQSPQTSSPFVQKDIGKALRSLPKDQRRCFMLYFQGFKYHEIAERLCVPIGTVKNRIHLARKDLKAQLHNYATD